MRKDLGPMKGYDEDQGAGFYYRLHCSAQPRIGERLALKFIIFKSGKHIMAAVSRAYVLGCAVT